MRRYKRWPIVCAALLVVAAALKFLLRGYEVIALLLVGIVALVVLKNLVGGFTFGVAMGLTCLLALAVAVTEVPIVSAARTDAPQDTRYLVVLGARVEKGQPSYSLLYRLQATLAYMEAHPDTVAILSGGQGADEDATEASVMYRWLVEHGIDPARLVMEEEARNTRENLAFSFDIIRGRGDDPSGCTAVVSSSYHLYRAELMARNMGVRVAGISSYPGNPVVALNYYIRG